MDKKRKLLILTAKVDHIKYCFVDYLKDDLFCTGMYVDMLFEKIDEELDEQCEKMLEQEKSEKV